MVHLSILHLVVLILIVVEDGLVPSDGVSYHTRLNTVLILIVVEDGLVRTIRFSKPKSVKVLILIVVEDGLVPRHQRSNR